MHVRCGENVFINFNCTIIDTCTVTIGARTLIGPNVSLYTGCHPLDPDVRRGTAGPEFGKEIRIGEDCWIGGGATVLPGVSVGRGSVIGAASVVTKAGSVRSWAGETAASADGCVCRMSPSTRSSPETPLEL